MSQARFGVGLVHGSKRSVGRERSSILRVLALEEDLRITPFFDALPEQVPSTAENDAPSIGPPQGGVVISPGLSREDIPLQIQRPDVQAPFFILSYEKHFRLIRRQMRAKEISVSFRHRRRVTVAIHPSEMSSTGLIR